MLTTSLKSEILTTSDVMEMLDVCRTTLTRMQNRGVFPIYRIGRRVYFKKSEIIAAIEAGRDTSIPELTRQTA